MSSKIGVCPIGGPTAIIEIGGLRLLTDPTFDPPGEHPYGRPRPLRKTEPAALTPDDVGRIDAVLLSHDQHPDNLDDLGREFLDHVPRVLTTVSGAQRLGRPAVPVPRWDHVDIARPEGALRVTSVPAQHGPDGSEHLTGEVTGFVLSGDDLPVVYISGDNQSLDVVRAIADRIGPVDYAVIHGGGAQLPYVFGDAYLTFNSADVAEAARILGARQVLPVHFDSWAHFTEGAADLRSAFAAASLADLLVLPERGELVHISRRGFGGGMRAPVSWPAGARPVVAGTPGHVPGSALGDTGDYRAQTAGAVQEHREDRLERAGTCLPTVRSLAK
jgi:L-ascorbate metabolism protein UlaG (beta-lactamase superfamily)